MNNQSLFFPFLVAIGAAVLILMAIQFLSKKLNIKYEKDNKINISYAIWASSILISFFILLKVALEETENAIEIIINPKCIEDAFSGVMQRIAINIGFTFIFTFLSYYIVYNVINLTLGKRTNSIEIEKDNRGYFILKGIILILFVISLVTVFEQLLKWFSPVVDIPFYH